MASLLSLLKRFPLYDHRMIQDLRARWTARQWSPDDREFLKFYTPFVAPGDLVFDVGANIGTRTKVFLKRGARVVAVEPQEECLRRIRVGFGRNPHLMIVPAVLGEAEGETELLVSDVSTVASVSSRWVESVRSSGRFSDFRWEKKQSVKVDTLDRLIARFGVPSFIKIDVEGYELQVLRGLTRPVRSLSFEYTPELADDALACLDHLGSLGEIRVNYTLGVGTSFALGEWVAPDEAGRELVRYRGDIRVVGDVYVKFPGLA